MKPKKNQVGPAPTVISSNLKTMSKVKAASAEAAAAAAPPTPGGKGGKYKVKAKPEKHLSATEKMRQRAEAGAGRGRRDATSARAVSNREDHTHASKCPPESPSSLVETSAFL